ncbi:hypothetical protein D3C85_1059550 [compost metagenome]
MAGREAVYRPYESTPLDLSDETLDAHQSDVRRMMSQLIDHELADKVSGSVLRFVHHSVLTRMIQRDGSNGASYTSRLHDTIPADFDEALRDEALQACAATKAGTALMIQSEVTRDVLGMPSAEYGNLTIIGSKRAEHFPDMSSEASELLGKDISGIKPYRIQVVGFDREPDGRKNNHLGAMRVKIKRHLGELDNGTEVKQRTMAIIDLSKNAGVDQDITQAIFEEYEKERLSKQDAKLARACMKLTANSDQDMLLREVDTHSNSIISSPPIYSAKYGKLSQVDMMIQELISRDMLDPLVLARNETIYGYNKEIDQQIRHNLDDVITRHSSAE